jgi:hypothetical protein
MQTSRLCYVNERTLPCPSHVPYETIKGYYAFHAYLTIVCLVLKLEQDFQSIKPYMVNC